ncbi:MAG: DUF4861 domain-containing protein [Muribaculum sp.]|nr:DUF4861 domain-containing protein [Muribaculaceae bacterium]MCM1081632.1 DUF4861 domain-containing protein [Muribaculum sp.]
MKVNAIILSIALVVPALAVARSLDVAVSNPTLTERVAETVEIPIADIRKAVGNGYLYVTSPDGKEVASQITYDSLLIFKTDIAPGAKVVYTVNSSAEPHQYPVVCTGRIYPERADDVAWENNLVGFRAYGPATQRRGEKAFGYDLFFKYPSEQPVVESLYNAQCSPANWAKVDSLRRIDARKAKEFENSFTYHLDHGKGMDCYAVGATLGAGGAAPIWCDSIGFAWCYDRAEILDKGPVRFTVRLTFAPRTIGAQPNVVETRIISLDRDSHLNRCRVRYENASAPFTLACGFPLRDNSPAVGIAQQGILAYADPTQGKDNGKALLGIVAPGKFKDVRRSAGHIIGQNDYDSTGVFEYYWGFAWSRADVTDLDKWVSTLISYNNSIEKPLIVKY